jgi:hypothetical protein
VVLLSFILIFKYLYSEFFILTYKLNLHEVTNG